MKISKKGIFGLFGTALTLGGSAIAAIINMSDEKEKSNWRDKTDLRLTQLETQRDLPKKDEETK